MSLPEIIFKINSPLDPDEVIRVYEDSGLRRPTQDKARILKMFEHSNLVISAWSGEELVGISRALTDFSYCCYLSDLAVKKEFQKRGIGTRLIGLTREQAGEGSMMLLLSAPDAMDYYCKIGMERVENGFILKRKN